ncbi:MAG: DEAD/DEAH box helicase [Candidatus Aenigmatarchaeota archaeon]
MTTAFDTLEPKVKRAVKKRFSHPTKIQSLVIPSILEGNNTLVISETGSGKTESVLFPIFDLFVQKEYRPISILYITPLKSLNRDLMKRITWWSHELEFDASVRHGDTTQYERSMQAQNPSSMLISTPETLQAILVGKVMREHLKNVKWVVIDEIHELIDNKRGTQLSIGLERLKELTRSNGNEIQIVGISATVGSPERVAKFLTGDKECKIINTAREREVKIHVESPDPTKEDYKTAESIMIGPAITARLRRITELIENKKSVLAFTNTRESSEVLSSRLRVYNPKIPMEVHHSSLSKDVRIKAEDDFKNEKLKILFCTSSLELGIDIGSIDFVLQYTSPRQVNKLLQRIGRSGHNISKIPEGVIISADHGDSFESTVIADHAIKGDIEETQMYEKALDVLGHQIMGLALEEYDIPMDKVYKIIKRAYPYKDLTKEEFIQVCDFMQRLRLLWMNQKDKEGGYDMSNMFLRRKRNSWEYYYRNLSTIPDSKNYRIIDIVTNKAVGSLDAEFIALHGSPGSAFIVKGQAWRIIDIDKTTVSVEPLSGLEASIPAWEGELIPVPFNIAQDVGKIRGITSKEKDPIKYLTTQYPIKKNVAEKIYETIKNQKKWGPVPTEKNVLVEHGHDASEEGFIPYVIINTCAGSLVNDTLGHALSTLLRMKFGSVGLSTDPYRITIKLPSPDWNEVIEMFQKLTPEILKETIKTSMPDTELFVWKFLHVAKRFSIISREADYGKNYIRKIIDVYKNTPVYNEAMNEIYQDKLDIEKTCEFLENINRGKVKIIVKDSLSPIGREGITRRYSLVSEKKPEKEILAAFKKRLLSTKFGLLCLTCGTWVATGTVKEIPDDLKCKKCQAKLVSVIPYRYLNEAHALMIKQKLGKALVGDEKKRYDHMSRTAGLVIDHGKEAVVVLAGRGIGPRAASRVLRKMLKGDDIIKEILSEERNYVKTRRFWKN